MKYALTGIAAFVSGVMLTLVYFAWQDEESALRAPDQPALFSNLFDDEFFRRSRDPFREMDRIRRHLDRHFSARDVPFPRFEPWFSDRFGEVEVGQIRTREDGEFVYIEVSFGEQQLTSIDVSTDDDTLSLSANAELVEEGRTMKSTVNQTLPIPPGVEPASMDVAHESGKVVIRFMKIPTP